MSKKRKARRPNIPLHTGPTSPAAAPVTGRDVGGYTPGRWPSRSAASSPAQINADYTHIANDLKRIALLAGGFFVVLVALSFFVH